MELGTGGNSGTTFGQMGPELAGITGVVQLALLEPEEVKGKAAEEREAVGKGLAVNRQHGRMECQIWARAWLHGLFRGLKGACLLEMGQGPVRLLAKEARLPHHRRQRRQAGRARLMQGRGDQKV